MSLAQLVPSRHDRPSSINRYSEGRAWVRVRGALIPDLIEARSGERLRLVFRREETAACSERIIFPSLGRSVMLPPFEDVAVDLGPLPAGEHEFRCELGILRGRVVVRPRATSPDLDVLGRRIVVRGQTTQRSGESTEREPAVAPDGGSRLGSYAQSEKRSS